MDLQELGAILRHRREEKGLSLDEVANKIKLSSRVIKAIEDGDISDLPHPVYARGFIKSYAEMLDIDRKELAEMLNQIFPMADLDEEPEPGPIIKATTDMERNSFKILNIVIMLLIFTLLCSGLWFLFVKYGETSLDGIKQTYNSFFSSSDQNEIINSTQNNTSFQATSNHTQTENSSNEITTSHTENIETVDSNNQTEAVVNTLELSARRNTKIEVTLDDMTTEKLNLGKNQSRIFEFKKGLTLKLTNPNAVKLKYNDQDFAFEFSANGGEKTLVFPPTNLN